MIASKRINFQVRPVTRVGVIIKLERKLFFDEPQKLSQLLGFFRY